LKNAILMTDIPVKDMKRAREFYEKKLGLKAMPAEMDSSLMLQTDDGGLIHLYQTKNSGGDATRMTFMVGDHAKAMADLRDSGISFEDYDEGEMKTKDGVLEMEGMIASWFKDPDGNILCLFEMAKVPVGA
jgi:predicted enzyme related to lactoylglutathione lyase